MAAEIAHLPSVLGGLVVVASVTAPATAVPTVLRRQRRPAGGDGDAGLRVGHRGGGWTRGAEPPVDDLAAEGGGDDERAERDELGREDLAVVGVTQVAQGPELSPRLEPATEDDHADRTQRQPRVARYDLTQLVEMAATQHDRKQDDQPAQPQGDTTDVRDVGDDRERDPSARARMAAEAGGEEEADGDDRSRRPPPPRQGVLDHRTTVHQEPEERDRDEEEHES